MKKNLGQIFLFFLFTMRLQAAEDELFLQIKVGDNYSYIDTKGVVRFNSPKPFYFPSTTVLSGTLLRMAGANGKYGLINAKGESVVDAKFDGIVPFVEDSTPVLINKKWGLISKTGEFILEPKYDSISPFQEGLARIVLNNKMGFVDPKGSLIIAIKYPVFPEGRFSDGLTIVSTDSGFQYIDKQEKVVVNLGWTGEPDSFYYGFARISDWASGKTLYQFIDKSGKKITVPKYEDAGRFSEEGLAPVEKDEKWGFIDSTGTEVIRLQYQWVGTLKHGLIPVELDGNFGYIDKAGRLVIGFKYGAAGQFSSLGTAPIKLGDFYGLIDAKGNPVLDPVYLRYLPSWTDRNVIYFETKTEYFYYWMDGKLIYRGQL